MPLQTGASPKKRIKIDNLISELVEKSVELKGALNPHILSLIGDQVRMMNCYYSNLIEGSPTKPKEIEDAMMGNFSEDLEIRDLQLEAKAHIEVQEMIDKNTHGFDNIVSIDFIKWIHREFFKRVPESFLYMTLESTDEKIKIIPGKFRERDVTVGRHAGVPFENIFDFMEKFVSNYDISKLGRHEQVAASAALHHRLLWIHPFMDGNGRVARLFTHAYLQEIGIGSDLWAVSRGFARNADKYKSSLALADKERAGDIDGRGSLSLKGLQDFCIFFLECCIDQIDFMNKLVDHKRFSERVEAHINILINNGELHKKSFRLVNEAIREGEFRRGEAGEIMRIDSRTVASKCLSDLLKKGILVSDSKKAPVRLGIPDDGKEFWLPGLFSE